MMNNSEEIFKNCIENKVPLGHFSRKWNPKMSKYLLMEKSNTHIIDINCILNELNKACEKLMSIVAAGGKVLFVCTKKIGRSYIESVANDLEMPYVTEKWFGGILTNFSVVKKMNKKIDSLNMIINSPSFKYLSKKEQMKLQRNINKKAVVLNGISKKMNRHPSAMIVVDAKKENIAIKEANRLGIPIFGLVDTNIDPDLISNPIPCNDDSLSSIVYIIERLKYSISEGLKKLEKNTSSSQEKQEPRERREKKFNK